ncbi:MAG: hypothetical protein A2033_15040, partial [Bacteroidetes bacterium GWA2_31_9]
IARINSYLIIPVGANKIVAIITRVKIQDETEIEKNSGSITLPKAQRYLVATMIGTIEGDIDYIQGVYNYPILDNPVWYVTKEDLNRIFDTEPKEKINYSEDFYLPVGYSPAFSDYKIRINPDKFFGKHAAILGNTGSGKSCTVASIIQSMFRYKFVNDKYKETELCNAHFVIFDTNGEYKRAFIGTKEKPFDKSNNVNALHLDQSILQVPFWFMNYDDFDYLFKPSEATQVPILKRSLSIAKNYKETTTKKLLPRTYLFYFNELLKECQSPDFKLRNRIYNELKDFCVEFNKLVIDYDTTEFKRILKLIYGERQKFTKPDKYIEGFLNPTVFSQAYDALSTELIKYNEELNKQVVSEERNIDLPVYFSYEKLVNQFIDNAVDELETSNNRIREYVATLKLRLQSFLNDERIAFPLMFKKKDTFNDALAIFIAFIVGDLFKIFDKGNEDIYSKYFLKKAEEGNGKEISKTKINQITIIDMSLLPFEVLETITGLIARLLLEFVSRFSPDDRGKFPIVMVLEEAQNYIPEKDRGDRISISKRVFERIAREGRKYGISLLVSSQRPSELSKTVLSQCNSFIIHRLQNPEDQKYVRQLVSSANEDILQQLPILPQQHAIITGDGVRTPVQMKVNTVNPKPNSENPEFVNNWIKDTKIDFPDYKKIASKWEKGEK